MMNDETDFLRQYPAYAATSAIDELRARDFAHLNGQVYLDFTGSGLYAQSQLEAHNDLLRTQLLGNPHSENKPSRRSTDLIEQTRDAILHFFNASANDYCVIFTSNASGALKLVGESYPFNDKRSLLVAMDNHNSVLGIREFAKAKGAAIGMVLLGDDLRLTNHAHDMLANQTPGLFAFPAQSNFTGVQHSLELIATAHQKGWDVLLDAAAFAPTNVLDIATWQPDFVPISFYKIFGWPTGVGCLIARKSALQKLNRPWFAGGTIWGVSALADAVKFDEAPAAFEDGTLNFAAIPAVRIGLDYVANMSLDAVHTRVQALAGWLLSRMNALQHANGKPVIVLYGPSTTESRGGTIAFNFLSPEGRVIDERVVIAAANLRNIALRAGCFCNPGAGEAAFRITEPTLRASFGKVASGLAFDDFLHEIGMPSGGAIRLSLGHISNFADVQVFLAFANEFIDNCPQVESVKARLHC